MMPGADFDAVSQVLELISSWYRSLNDTIDMDSCSCFLRLSFNPLPSRMN